MGDFSTKHTKDTKKNLPWQAKALIAFLQILRELPPPYPCCLKPQFIRCHHGNKAS